MWRRAGVAGLGVDWGCGGGILGNGLFIPIFVSDGIITFRRLYVAKILDGGMLVARAEYGRYRGRMRATIKR